MRLTLGTHCHALAKKEKEAVNVHGSAGIIPSTNAKSAPLLLMCCKQRPEHWSISFFLAGSLGPARVL